MFNVLLGNSHSPTVSVHVSMASLQSLFGKPEAVPIATILHTHTRKRTKSETCSSVVSEETTFQTARTWYERACTWKKQIRR